MVESTVTTGGTTTGYIHVHLPQQGWECPRCRKINAPWLAQCPCPAAIISSPTVQPWTWPTSGETNSTADSSKLTVIQATQEDASHV